MRGDSISPYNSMGIEEVVQVLHRYLRNKNCMNGNENFNNATNRFTELFLSLVSRKNFKNDEEKRICFKIAWKLSPYSKQLSMFFSADAVVNRSYPNLLDLPDELLVMIAKHLHPSEQQRFTQVCQRFRYMITDLNQYKGRDSLSWHMQVYGANNLRSLIGLLARFIASIDSGTKWTIGCEAEQYKFQINQMLFNIFGVNIDNYLDSLSVSPIKKHLAYFHKFGASLPVHGFWGGMIGFISCANGFTLYILTVLFYFGSGGANSSVLLVLLLLFFVVWVCGAGLLCTRLLCDPDSNVVDRWREQSRSKRLFYKGVQFTLEDINNIYSDLIMMIRYLEVVQVSGDKAELRQDITESISSLVEKLKKIDKIILQEAAIASRFLVLGLHCLELNRIRDSYFRINICYFLPFFYSGFIRA